MDRTLGRSQIPTDTRRTSAATPTLRTVTANADGGSESRHARLVTASLLIAGGAALVALMAPHLPHVDKRVPTRDQEFTVLTVVRTPDHSHGRHVLRDNDAKPFPRAD